MPAWIYICRDNNKPERGHQLKAEPQSANLMVAEMHGTKEYSK